MTNSTMKYNEEYDFEICLIGWYYGIDPLEVKLEKFSAEDLEKAENFMNECHMDPVSFWNGDNE